MKLCEIIGTDGYVSDKNINDIIVDKITIFTEEIEINTLLVILNPRKTVKLASLQKLPVAVLCGEETYVPEDIPTIRVSNVRYIMSFAFSKLLQIDYSKLKFIGITGTNGKTSTATFIKKILSDAGYKTGFIGTGIIECQDTLLSDENYSMTTPDPWVLYPAIKKMQDCGCNIVIMEVSSHSLTLDKVAPIPYEYGIFTNMTAEHMDFHADMENYFLAKQKLFSKCRTGVFNIDNKYARRACREFEGRKITAGVLWKGDVWATHIINRGFDGIEYMYRDRSFLFKMRLRTAGIYNVYNSMLAGAVCKDMGVKPCDIKKSLGDINVLSGRFEIIKDDITVIIDYAHTTAAFDSLMSEIKHANIGGRSVSVVFGCGGERDKEKRPNMAKVAEKYANKIFVTSDNSRSEEVKGIITDIIQGFSTNNYEIIENRAEAIKEAVLSCPDNGIVAVIGKGCEKYNIDKHGYHSFDEKKIICECLSQRQSKTPL